MTPASARPPFRRPDPAGPARALPALADGAGPHGGRRRLAVRALLSDVLRRDHGRPQRLPDWAMALRRAARA